MSSKLKKKRKPEIEQMEEDTVIMVGRSKRQSTMICSAATQSAIRQNASSSGIFDNDSASHLYDKTDTVDEMPKVVEKVKKAKQEISSPSNGGRKRSSSPMTTTPSKQSRSEKSKHLVDDKGRIEKTNTIDKTSANDEKRKIIKKTPEPILHTESPSFEKRRSGRESTRVATLATDNDIRVPDESFTIDMINQNKPEKTSPQTLPLAESEPKYDVITTSKATSTKKKAPTVSKERKLDCLSSEKKSKRVINSPVSVDATSPSPARRSGRDSTRIATLATSQAIFQDENKELVFESPPPIPRKPRSTVTPDNKDQCGQTNEIHNTKSCDVRLTEYATEENAKTFDELSPKEVKKLYKELLPSPKKKPREKHVQKSPDHKKIDDKICIQVEGGKNILASTELKVVVPSTPTNKSPRQELIKSPRDIKNDLMFDALIDPKAALEKAALEPKEKKRVAKDIIVTSTPIGDVVKTTSKQPIVNKTSSIVPVTSNAKLPISPSTPSKSPRVIAPWRQLGLESSKNDLNGEGTTECKDDVYEFMGFPDDPPTTQNHKGGSSKPLSTRRKSRGESKDQQKDSNKNQHCTSWGRPTNRMFMVAPVQASDSVSISKAQDPASDTSNIGEEVPMSPDAQHNPDIKSHPISGENNVSSVKQEKNVPRPFGRRMFSMSPRSDRISSPRAEHYRNLSSIHADLQPDRPGISLTSLASDFDIVASVSKFSEVTHKETNETLDKSKDKSVPVDAHKAKKSVLTRIFSKPGSPSSNNEDNAQLKKKDQPHKDTTESEEISIKSTHENETTPTETSSTEVPTHNNTSLLHPVPEQLPTINSNESIENSSQDVSDNSSNDQVQAENNSTDTKSRRNKTPVVSNSSSVVTSSKIDNKSDMKADSINGDGDHQDKSKRKSIESHTNNVKKRKKSIALEIVDNYVEADLEKDQREIKSQAIEQNQIQQPRKSRQSTIEHPSVNLNISDNEDGDITSNKKNKRNKSKSLNSNNEAKTIAKTKQDTSNIQSSSRVGRRVATGKKTEALTGLVLTTCHSDDKALARQLVTKFGKFRLDSGVTNSTSHVVSGGKKRTMSLLKALMKGCWVLSQEWVLASLEAGHWVGEEPYELVDFSPSVRGVRQDKEAADGEYQSELFKDMGSMFISRDCRATATDLEDLILLGGGKIAKTSSLADVVVGESVSKKKSGAECVTEKWMLDSVQYHVIMPFSDYLI